MCPAPLTTVESHNPEGTPLSSPGTPLVPLVVECGGVLAHCQITESPWGIKTFVGENTRPPLNPMVTFVVAPKLDYREMKNAATAATVSILMVNFIVRTMRGGTRDFVPKKFGNNRPTRRS
jgi:hypothetical protein